ncbi:MAG: tail fiber domain-containing protein [Vicingaceae bacterium]|jgi:endosialidase-like protein|nr:tail fiber domain-containing protein [Flavobacteriales bacterium]MDF1675929.1 tail fiber domain-containing protein [Vicingaceae bacterium]|tara:strand:- start:26167 stop:27486 length:1320 start_codon:yes stop_codon:yes gene_type:complete
MKKKYILSSAIMLSLALFSVTNPTKAQNIGINATGAAPDAGAMLDISSTNKGLLIPRVNIANLATIAPITGSTTVSMLVYNTNATTGQGYHYWNGTTWVKLSTGDAWELTGNAATNAATNFLGTTDNIDFSIRRNNLERFRLNTTSVVFNENSYDYDFRIESNNQANIFFIDGGSDEIGIRTNAPTSMLHMTNGGVNVGANAMASFDNLGIDGVSISGYNQGTTNGYNGMEGITAYNGTGFIPAGVMGLAIYQGAANAPTLGVMGATNEWQGTGVRGQRFNSGGANSGWGGLFLNDLGYTGGVFNASDKRLKTNITTIKGAISIIDKLTPVSYNYDLEKYPSMGLNTEKEFGFIAQEIQEILPEIVREKYLPTNGTERVNPNTPIENKNELFLTMDYTRLIPLAIQGIKEQQSIIEAQNAKIDALEKIILELQKAIENK